MARLWTSSLPTTSRLLAITQSSAAAASSQQCGLALLPRSSSSSPRAPAPVALRVLNPPLRLRLTPMLQQQQRSVSFGTARAVGIPDGVGGSTKFKEREILVQHLLVPADQLQLLLDLQRQVLQDGVDLSDLAAEHSICASKSEGGMLGWISLGRTVPEFEEAAFKAPLNKLVRVKTKHGWHLLQVLSEREASFLRDIDVEEFSGKMEDPEFLQEVQLLDVREPDEIATASIEGFKAYPLSQFGKWAPSITEDLDPAKDTYVLCHHGVRSQQAAQWLKSQGFTRLYNISGGIHAYSVKVDDSIPKY
ncbi:hypothetical protein M758_4G133800 [Ceratodon purpureus]|uniref:Peptidylprolyl isomerase n=1 Tax=Ceratodon purpureus TaxID=3225 RepID=A0A8T0IAG1_CERPU|nr:hypothetical protein KC19_4G132500 [Ceratodon purpureus]KAG0619360.1 hypothetical protein M758_4G133800 [Ceratodon purpureus]